MKSQPPLSHHEILGLVAPFTRQGRHVDLATSDRAARELAFRPVEHAAQSGPGGSPLPALTESLRLTQTAPGRWRLVRELRESRAADAAVARLEAEGDDTDALLAAVQDVPPARQFLAAGGVLAALSHRLSPPRGAADTPALVLRAAHAAIGPLALEMTVSSVPGYPAEFMLRRHGPGPAGVSELPDDLFEVLGQAWGRLTAVPRGWSGSVGLVGAEPRRSASAEQRLGHMLEHLARTLAEPPGQFHVRHRAARWRVAVQRTWPVALGAGLVGGAWWFHREGSIDQPTLGLVANLAPPLLMGLFFLRREMPRIELPRPPRRLRADAWQVAAP